MENAAKKKSGLATAGMVLGIVGICTSFIPIVNNASFALGAIAILFGVITLIKRASLGKTVVALILGVLSIVITLTSQASLSKAIDETISEIDSTVSAMTGEATEDILKNHLDVEIGTFAVVEGEYFDETKLPVKITNKGSKAASFVIEIEAVNENGDRLTSDTIYANNLNAGQTQNVETFTYVDAAMQKTLTTATFKIIEVSML